MAIKTYQCFTCGAELKWNPALQKWKCEFCDSEFVESDFKEIATGEEDECLEKKTAPEGKTQQTAEGEVVSYKCSYCGAEVVTTADTAASFCVYCQRPVIMESNLSGEFKPKAVLPFKTTKDDAKEAFRKYLKKKILIPDIFRDQDHIEKISGVYLPFWLFNSKTEFHYQGEGSIVTTWSDSNYRYTKTDTYGITRGGSMSFTKIPVDGSSKTEDGIVDSIEPFHWDELTDFATPYLSGFLAERYDLKAEDLLDRVENRCCGTKESQLSQTLQQYTHTFPVSNTFSLKEVESEYVLLPVWLLYTQYKEKNYLFAMNGQTGKLVGNLPIDKGKVLKYSLLSFLTGGLVSALIGILLWLGGLFS